MVIKPQYRFLVLSLFLFGNKLEKGEKLVIIEEDGYLKILPPTDLRTLCGSWSDLDPKAVRKQIEDMRKEDRY
ncbi:MAG TPA: hypothetical protein VF354_01940 [Candidatus Methanoperedens sp.]